MRRDHFPGVCALLAVVLLAARARHQAMLLALLGLLWLTMVPTGEETDDDDDDDNNGRRRRRRPCCGRACGGARRSYTEAFDPVPPAAPAPTAPPALQPPPAAPAAPPPPAPAPAPPPPSAAPAAPAPPPPSAAPAAPPPPAPTPADDEDEYYYDDERQQRLVVSEHVGGGRPIQTARCREMHELQRSRLPMVLSSQALLKRVTGSKPTHRRYRSTTGQTSSFAFP